MRGFDSLKGSVLTAFYTPKEITDTLAGVLAGHGVVPARLLDPSAGMGAFVDSMLRHAPQADVMAFEKDLLTGRMLRHLHPDMMKCIGEDENGFLPQISATFVAKYLRQMIERYIFARRNEISPPGEPQGSILGGRSSFSRMLLRLRLW